MSERKFTDEEIIAVVKRCASPVNECEGCPFEGIHRGDRECFNVATDELIEIASRQKKELAVLKQSEWISVDERLPSEDERRDEYGELVPFLVCEKHTKYPYRAFYDGTIWGDGLMKIKGITHWMPLPEPPKMKGGE